jgi:hypothetical protein
MVMLTSTRAVMFGAKMIHSGLNVIMAEQIADLLQQQPAGMAESEIARALTVDRTGRKKLSGVCRALIKAGRISRRGGGGRQDPYLYSSTSLL